MSYIFRSPTELARDAIITCLASEKARATTVWCLRSQSFVRTCHENSATWFPRAVVKNLCLTPASVMP